MCVCFRLRTFRVLFKQINVSVLLNIHPLMFNLVNSRLAVCHSINVSKWMNCVHSKHVYALHLRSSSSTFVIDASDFEARSHASAHSKFQFRVIRNPLATQTYRARDSFE